MIIAGTEQIRTGGRGSEAHHDAGDWTRAAQQAPAAGGGGSGGGGAAERHVEWGKGKDSRRRRCLRV